MSPPRGQIPMRYLVPLRALMRVAALWVLVAIATNCHFDESGIAPTESLGYCSATVRGLAGDGTEFTITNSDPELVDHFLAGWCVSGPGTWSERLSREWEGHLADTLAGDFRSHPGPWCVVEGSSRCAWGDPVDPFYPCPPPSSGASLAFCPGVTGPICVDVAPLLDFGAVDVGATKVLPLAITNSCSDPIEVRAGESILGLQADEFEIVDNRCAPAPGDSFRSLAPAGSAGDRCELDVAFTPISPETRSAEYHFVESPQTTLAVPLRGEGVGASATVSPDYLCLDPPLSGAEQCTAPGDFTVANLGPGGIRVVDSVLDPTTTGFRLIDPTPQPGSFIARSAMATVRVEWCQALTTAVKEDALYSLTLTTQSAASQTFEMKMEYPCP